MNAPSKTLLWSSETLSGNVHRWFGVNPDQIIENSAVFIDLISTERGICGVDGKGAWVVILNLRASIRYFSIMVMSMLDGIVHPTWNRTNSICHCGNYSL